MLLVAGAATTALIACGDTLASNDDLPAPSRDAGVDVVTEDGRANEEAGSDVVVPAAACDLDQPFGQPVPVDELDSIADEASPHLTDDELRIVFQSRRENGGEPKFFVAERASRSVAFGAPAPLPLYVFGDTDPTYSGDGLSLYFGATRGADNYAIWKTERATLMGTWSLPFEVNGIGTSDNEFQPFFRAGGLWYTRVANASTRSIWFAKYTSGAFAPGVKVDGLDDTTVDDEVPTPSADGLAIYFASRRMTTGDLDIWFARRSNVDQPFAAPQRVVELSTTRDDVPAWLSPDGCRLYIVRATTKDGAFDLDIYVAAKPVN